MSELVLPAALRDVVEHTVGRFAGLFIIRPVHNPVGPLDFAGIYDERSDRVHTIAELVDRGLLDRGAEQIAHRGLACEDKQLLIEAIEQPTQRSHDQYEPLVRVELTVPAVAFVEHGSRRCRSEDAGCGAIQNCVESNDKTLILGCWMKNSTSQYPASCIPYPPFRCHSGSG